MNFIEDKNEANVEGAHQKNVRGNHFRIAQKVVLAFDIGELDV